VIRIGVLVSGSGSNLQSIIDACGRGAIDGEVSIVLSNVEGAYALERARTRGIPTRVISPAEYLDRETFDRELAGALHEYRVDLVALAGFMRVLTPAFLRQFPGRIMNIHPALLPSFPGLHVRQKAIDHGVRFSGCTVHFVDEGVDTGPVILQDSIVIENAVDADAVLAALRPLEHRLLPEAVRLVAAGAVRADPAVPRRMLIRRDP